MAGLTLASPGALIMLQYTLHTPCPLAILPPLTLLPMCMTMILKNQTYSQALHFTSLPLGGIKLCSTSKIFFGSQKNLGGRPAVDRLFVIL